LRRVEIRSLGTEVHLALRKDKVLRTFDPLVQDVIVRPRFLPFRRPETQGSDALLTLLSFSLRSLPGLLLLSQTSHLATTGIHLHTHTRVVSVTRADPNSPLTITLQSFADGSTSTVEADQLVWAIGRAPSSKNLGLEELGIKTNDKGDILSNDFEETNVNGVFAIGDITGSFPIVCLLGFPSLQRMS
jgi:glutathione reductase (NADPH)